MTAQALPRAVRAGCQGIAMLSGLWENETPTRLVATAASSLAKAAYRIKRV
jgi:thiamine monophosphate synthase